MELNFFNCNTYKFSGEALKTLARCKLRYNKNTATDVVTLTENQKLTGTIWFEVCASLLALMGKLWFHVV